MSNPLRLCIIKFGSWYYITYSVYPIHTTVLLSCVMFYVCVMGYWWMYMINTFRPRQNGRHFADDNFKCIFLNENIWIPIKISLKFVRKGPINNIRSLVQIVAWRRPGDKQLSESMMVSFLTHICASRPQWVNLIILYRVVWLPLWLLYVFPIPSVTL